MWFECFTTRRTAHLKRAFSRLSRVGCRDAVMGQLPDATAGSDDLLLPCRDGGARALDLAGDFPTVSEGVHHAVVEQQDLVGHVQDTEGAGR